MAMPINGWGEPSYSRDIVSNYTKTHHSERVYENSFFFDFINPDVRHFSERPYKDVWVKNDEDYLNSRYKETDEIIEHYSNSKQKFLDYYFEDDDLDSFEANYYFNDTSNADSFTDFFDFDEDEF